MDALIPPLLVLIVVGAAYFCGKVFIAALEEEQRDQANEDKLRGQGSSGTIMIESNLEAQLAAAQAEIARLKALRDPPWEKNQ